MAKFTDAIRDNLISFFNAGDQPTEAQFTALILAIQEGIEEHDHDGTGDGDGVANLVGPVGIGTVPAAGNILHVLGTGGGEGIVTIAPDSDVNPARAAILRLTEKTATWQGGYIRYDGAANRVYIGCHDETDVIAANDDDYITLSRTTGFVKIGPAGEAAYDLEVEGDAPRIQIDATTGNPTVNFAEAGANQWSFYYNVTNNYWAIGETGVSDHFMILDGGLAGFNTPFGSIAARVHITVDDGDAVPVLTLEQKDVSEGTINFVASERGVIGEGTNSVQSVRVELNGTVYRLAVYANA